MHTKKMIRHLAIFVSLSGIFPFSMQVAQAEPALTSIEVTPSNPSIDVAQTLQFSATGTFDDGSSRPLAADVWTSGTPLPATQTNSGVTVLHGSFHVIGGFHPQLGITLPTVNGYNPTSQTWTPLSPLRTSRACPGVGVVGGIIYAVGGSTKERGMPSVPLNTVEAYHPGRNAWKTMASMSTLSGCVQASVVNGILYAVGTAYNGTVVVEAYDPATNLWSVKTPLILPPNNASLQGFATAALDGNLYILGGMGSHGSLSKVNAYDPMTDTWSTKAPMPTQRSWLGAGVVNGILYAVGGSWPLIFGLVEAYNPKTNTWATMTSMPRSVEAYVAADDESGLLYALTPVEYPQNFVDFRNIWSYKPPEALWSSSNASIATTDGNGFVTASVVSGTSTITAAAGDVSGSSTLTTLPQPLRGLRVRVQSIGGASGTVATGPGTLINSGILCPGDCTEKYVIGTTVVLTAFPTYPLVSYFDWGGDCAGQGNPCTLQMDAYRSVTAIFTQEPDY